jgi:hypothetical protein
MKDWVPRLLEVTALSMVLWCLADAWRRGPRAMAELLAGALFGLLAEQAAIWAGALTGRPDAYRYGNFAWMLTPDVPVVVVAAWGALLYAAMQYSDSLGIPRWLRPAADGLYALMLDLSMEVAAVRLGLWQWRTDPGAQWFGVPYSNFGGWLLVALLFSITIRAARSVAGSWSPLGYGALLGGLSVGMAGVAMAVMGRLFQGAEQDSWTVGLLALLAVAQVGGGLLWRRTAPAGALGAALADAQDPAGLPPGWLDPALGLPVCWHLTYLGTAALSGVFAAQPSVLFLTGTMAALGTLLAVGLLPVRAA